MEFLNLQAGKSGGNTDKVINRYYKAYNFDPVAIT
jgi:hypothetical protein